MEVSRKLEQNYHLFSLLFSELTIYIKSLIVCLSRN